MATTNKLSISDIERIVKHMRDSDDDFGGWIQQLPDINWIPEVEARKRLKRINEESEVKPMFDSRPPSGAIVSEHTVTPPNWAPRPAFTNVLHLHRWVRLRGLECAASKTYASIKVYGSIEDAEELLEYCMTLNHEEHEIFPTKADFRNSLPVNVAGEVDLTKKVTTSDNIGLTVFGIEVWNWLQDYGDGRHWIFDDKIVFDDIGTAVGFKTWFDERIKSPTNMEWVFHRGNRAQARLSASEKVLG